MSFLFLKIDFGGKISKINPAKIAPILDQMTKMELFAFFKLVGSKDETLEF
jgi:hypothetical protein